MNLKKISEQTIVITGATSGIGLTTARMAAEKGANLVLVARNEEALRELAEEINAGGGRAIFQAADVANEPEMRAAANKAKAEFGGVGFRYPGQQRGRLQLRAHYGRADRRFAAAF
jgi:NADP-dependent 3-hydroxy acid dehydrogenase YdfG